MLDPPAPEDDENIMAPLSPIVLAQLASPS